MPVIEIEIEQLKEAFESLSIKEKIKLVEEFEKETRRARWDSLINKVKKRAKKSPIAQREIKQICKQVRQELYAKRVKSNN